MLSLNTYLGKTKSPKERRNLLKVAKEQGVRTDLDHLSTQNFSDAIKILPQFQKEFRQHFSQYFDEKTLEQIEEEETDIYTGTWSLLYQFAHNPAWKQPLNPLKEAKIKIEKTFLQGRKERKEKRKKREQGAGGAGVWGENIAWDEEKNLWITCDTNNPLNLFHTFEAVQKALKKALGKIEVRHLQWYVLDFSWPSIFVVPLVKGKSLTKTAWKINTSVFILGSMFKEKDWWNYVLHPIPKETWESLNLPSWENNQLETANRLQEDVNYLYLIIAHLCDLNKIPENSDKELIQKYLNSVSPQIERYFNRSQKQYLGLQKFIEELQQEDLENNLSSIAIKQLYIKMWDNIPQEKDCDGELKMNFSNLEEWLKRLETAREQARILFLSIAAKVLV